MLLLAALAPLYAGFLLLVMEAADRALDRGGRRRRPPDHEPYPRHPEAPMLRRFVSWLGPTETSGPGINWTELGRALASAPVVGALGALVVATLQAVSGDIPAIVTDPGNAFMWSSVLAVVIDLARRAFHVAPAPAAAQLVSAPAHVFRPDPVRPGRPSPPGRPHDATPAP